MHFFKMKGNELFRCSAFDGGHFRRNAGESGLHRGRRGGDTAPGNQRITDAVASRLGVPKKRSIRTSLNTGILVGFDTIAMDECIQSGRIKEGDLVLLTAFGGGVTWGACLIRF